ncbi:hypothetical protein SmJEL517_g05447 [Synchytrium microbalum]|uniref:Homeobox domain-containing protein n=1 Tax=Synchytrium microbalum TaxID=1806994 RepID=A0A507BV56_9FUNG|nr:uncharacterized protein SmJEL517_g05447 [Synchytrium microbalum]TPX31138.1 hypothetical protein SmJEL517_g05447 [Synchytrium microbalum]
MSTTSSSDHNGLLSMSPEPNVLTQSMQQRASPAFSLDSSSNPLLINVNYQPLPLVTIHKSWVPSIQGSLIPLMFQYDHDHQHILAEADGQIKKLSTSAQPDEVNVYLVAARDVLTKQIEYYERALNVLAPTSSGASRQPVGQTQQQEYDDEDEEEDKEAIHVIKQRGPAPKKAKALQQNTGRGVSRTPRPRPHNSTRHNSDQVQILLDSYNRKEYLTPTERVRLANETGLTQKQVVAWFTNKRSRDPQRQQGKTVQDRYSSALPSSKRTKRSSRRKSLEEEEGLSEDEYLGNE